MSEFLRFVLLQLNNLSKKGSFAQNIGIVFSGNILNFTIQVILTPVMSRIYGPEAYGEYAYFNLVVTNLVFLGGLSLPTVYVIAPREYDFFALGKAVLTSVLIVTVLSFFGYLLFRNYLSEFSYQYTVIPLLIILIFLNSVNAIFTNSNIRGKYFKRNSLISVLGNLFSRGGSIGFGYFLFASGIGLLIGDLIRGILNFTALTSNKMKGQFLLFVKRSNHKYIRSIFKKNIDVVKYIFPSQVLNKFTYDIPLLIIGGYFSKEHLGYFTFAVAILNIPRNLVARAIQPVFYQKANEIHQHDPDTIGHFVERIFISALLFTFLPFTIISIWAPEIFAFVFGNEWETAGKIASLLTFQFILATIAESFGGIRRILGLQKRILILTIFSAILRILPFVMVFFEINFYRLIFLYSFAQAFFIVFSFSDLFVSIMNRKKAIKNMVLTLIIFTIGVLISIGSLI